MAAMKIDVTKHMHTINVTMVYGCSYEKFSAR